MAVAFIPHGLKSNHPVLLRESLPPFLTLPSKNTVKYHVEFLFSSNRGTREFRYSFVIRIDKELLIVLHDLLFVSLISKSVNFDEFFSIKYEKNIT